MSATQPWQRVFVRHLVVDRRNEVDRLSSIVKPSFETRSRGSQGGGDTIWCQPTGRWMVGVGFPKIDWVSFFSNADSPQQIFERSATSKRVEAAWIGFDPQHGGWFFWFNRGGKAVVRFTQSEANESQPEMEADDATKKLIAQCPDAKSAWEILCQQFEVPEKSPELVVEDGKFVVLGVRGKPVKGTNRGIINYSGPELTEGENQAADKLEKGLDRWDFAGVRAALEAGASVDVKPDSSVSPLLSVLFHWDEPEAPQMAELLLEYGANVNGRSDDEPPLVSLHAHFVSDEMSYGAGKFLLEHGADVEAKNSFGKTALFEAVLHKKIDSVKLLLEYDAKPSDELVTWVRERIARDLKYEKQSDYIEYLTLLTGETIELPKIEQLPPELRAENERFAQYIQISHILKSLEAGFTVRKDRASDLAKVPETQQWGAELEQLGFEETGRILLMLAWNIRPSLALINVAQKMEAIITIGGPQLDQIRVDVGVYHPDDYVTVVSNLAQESVMGFKSSHGDFTHVPDADAKTLITTLQEKLAQSQREVVPIEATTFLDRYRRINERVLEELKVYLQNLRDTQAILVEGAPTRFEKLKCYFDFSKNKDPTWCSRKIVEGCQEDLQESLEVDLKNDEWEMKRGIRASYDLALARHLQFAGAPDSTDFLATGCEVALKFFEYHASRPKPYNVQAMVEEFEKALLLATLAGDWDVFGRLCETLRSKIASPKSRMPDDPSLEEGLIMVMVGSHFRENKIAGVDKLPEIIRQTRKKRMHFLLDAWEAIENNSPPAFQKAIDEAVKKHAARTSGASSWYEMGRMIALPESILVAVAQHEGITGIELSESASDRLITRASIGL
ncbi:ankyrin repeat domain-containing protein [Blastopirellula marina]|uniref:Uncharacterized protein n=1 Tax=Blastopirellula marina TaxID=124 RepID=A0A2S8G295_9BACT|nr:ankyrin repeat domain-containing protein [Blastopirellula marina]PQO38430.1 hypothetical protein C5Y98_10240 [Blastopirellula marina]PTL45087.1 hypothetical protein C5Y97_10250 [Blastopirellula marina]